MNKLSRISTGILAGALFSGSALADPYVTYPGTAARGMGTAFTAVATDVSAIWYNPAAIALQGNSITIEASQSPGFAAEVADSVNDINGYRGVVDEFGSDDTTIFVAGTWSADLGGFGFYYYEPYKFQTSLFTEIADSEFIVADFDEEISIIGMSFSVASEERNVFRWAVGASLEYVMVDDNSTLFLRDENPDPSTETPIDLDGDENGFSGTLSTLITLYQPEQGAESFAPNGWKYNVGATYRFPSNVDADETEVSTSSALRREDLLFKKPESYDIGLAASTQFLAFGMSTNLTLAYSYTESDYSEASDIAASETEKQAFGVSWTLRPTDLFVDQIDLRLGVYSTDVSSIDPIATGPGIDLGTEADLIPEVEGFTFGAGVRFGDFILDFAAEDRQINDVATCGNNSLRFQVANSINVNQCLEDLGVDDFDDWFYSASLRYLLR